jgi:hypothetical protein
MMMIVGVIVGYLMPEISELDTILKRVSSF